MTDHTHCPYNRIPAVDQALELADEMHDSEERIALLNASARLWITLTEAITQPVYFIGEPEQPETEEPSGLS